MRLKKPCTAQVKVTQGVMWSTIDYMYKVLYEPDNDRPSVTIIQEHVPPIVASSQSLVVEVDAFFGYEVLDLFLLLFARLFGQQSH